MRGKKAEGSREYDEYMSFLSQDEDLVSEAMHTIINEKQGYGFTEELAESAIRKMGHIDTSNTVDTVQYNQKKDNVIVIETDSELAERIAVSNKSKYTVIRDYLVEKFHGQTFTLSDGKTAVMDKSDAQELSHKADDVKTAELSNLKQIVETAELFAETQKVSHNKFDAFSYYAVTVSFNNQNFDIVVNVGRSKNNGTYHIYDITKKRRTANQSSTGLSRPGGNAIKNSSSINSISDFGENVNSLEENYLTDAEQSFINELNAHMSEKLLGEDEAFIEKLVRDNTTLAEKVMNRIDDLKCALESLQSAEARAEYNRLRRAEKLYLKAVSAAGMIYRNGKIVYQEEDEVEAFSLKYTTDNRAVAVIENDIFKGKFNELSESERIKIVRNAIKDFRPGIPVSGRLIKISHKLSGHCSLFCRCNLN